MSETVRCWSCGEIVPRALTESTLNPSIRLCYSCAAKMGRKKASDWNGLSKQMSLLNAEPMLAGAR